MSFLEKLPAEKTRAVSARVPIEIIDEYDILVERVKSYGYTISISRIIISAIQNAVKATNEELDKMPAPTAAQAKTRRGLTSKAKSSAGGSPGTVGVVGNGGEKAESDNSTFEIRPDREVL